VNKGDVEKRHVGLSGIVAIVDPPSAAEALVKLIAALSDYAPSRGVIPLWENPAHRFLYGQGEINLNSSDGPTTTIFELLLHLDDGAYPLWLAGRTFSKEDLLVRVAEILAADPQRVKNWVFEDGYRALWDMCVKHGIDPAVFA